MYVSPNFKTKKALKEAIIKGQEVFAFSPGPFPCNKTGIESIEGPHYPAAHTWYARVMVNDFHVTKVLS